MLTRIRFPSDDIQGFAVDRTPAGVGQVNHRKEVLTVWRKAARVCGFIGLGVTAPGVVRDEAVPPVAGDRHTGNADARVGNGSIHRLGDGRMIRAEVNHRDRVALEWAAEAQRTFASLSPPSLALRRVIGVSVVR